MAKVVKRIARARGAKISESLPDTDGGAVGMARLAAVLTSGLSLSKERDQVGPATLPGFPIGRFQ